jgi:hypothetical protein
MDLKTIGEEIAKIGLPLLGAVLPIPGGAAIGAALASAIGSPSAEPVDILAKLTQDADALQKARQFELAHTETMLKLQIEQEQNEYAHDAAIAQVSAGDTANAREREEKTGDVWTPRLIALVVLVMYGYVQWFSLSHVIPVESRDLATRGMGILDMAVGLVLGYYFGSSLHAARTTELLAKK